MSHLFLTSQVQYVARDIGRKLRISPGAKLAFINTCIKDKHHGDLGWHHRNKSSLEDIGFTCIEYDIAGKSIETITSDLGSCQYMYVEGGNSYYLLQESQKNNFSVYITKRINDGMVYIGTSAGSVIVGPDIEPVRRDETTPLAPDLKGTLSYGVVPFVIMPHWGQEKRRDFYRSTRMDHIYHEDYPYIFLSDNQYIEVIDGSYQIINLSSN